MLEREIEVITPYVMKKHIEKSLSICCVYVWMRYVCVKDEKSFLMDK